MKNKEVIVVNYSKQVRKVYEILDSKLFWESFGSVGMWWHAFMSYKYVHYLGNFEDVLFEDEQIIHQYTPETNHNLY